MTDQLTPEQRREIEHACQDNSIRIGGAEGSFLADPTRIAAYVKAKVQEALAKRMIGTIDYNSPEFHDGYITGFAEGSGEYKEQYGESKEKLVDFIEAKVREEREACAVHVENLPLIFGSLKDKAHGDEYVVRARYLFAAAIRARGTGK